MNAEDIRDCFNQSFMAHFFPNIVQTEAGQEYLLALSNYVLSCGNGKHIASQCPDILCCFAQNYIAWLLASWASADISENGDVGLTDPASCAPATYLKSKEIGGLTCEFDVIDVQKTCCPCPETAVTAWRKEWERLLHACSVTYMPIAGSCMPKGCAPAGCGCGADYWIY